MFKIKQIPEDFVVKENMYFKPQSKGDYTYFLLTKKNWDSLKAIDKLAKVFKVNVKQFGLSGLKDKHGLTTQYVSCYKLEKSKLSKLKLKDMKLQFLGFSDKPLGVGSHKSNSFVIVVRNIKKTSSLLQFVCNYFDDQRFGGLRPINHLIGKSLLQGKFEQAMKIYLTRICPGESQEHKRFRKAISKSWGKFKVNVPGYLTNEVKVIKYLQKHPKDFKRAFDKLPKRLVTLFIHAFQAFLFNNTLSDYINKNFKDSFAIEYSLGKLHCTKENLRFQLLLPGHDFIVKEDIDKIMMSNLKKEKITLKMFEKFSIKTSNRSASIGLSNLKLSELSEDELNPSKSKQTVSFTIPKGSFGTIVVKFLLRSHAL